jgi:hypothetical protein
MRSGDASKLFVRETGYYLSLDPCDETQIAEEKE